MYPSSYELNLNRENFIVRVLAGALFIVGLFACSYSASGQDANSSTEVKSNSAPLKDKSPSDSSNHTLSLLQVPDQTEAQKITDNIYQATGFGNTFLVTTQEGNVVIDTSLARTAEQHKALLDKVDARAPKYILITHAHPDHIGGLSVWKGDDSKVVMQANVEEFLHYQSRLKGFFARRNAAQFGVDIANFDLSHMSPGNYAAEIPVDVLFDSKYTFSLGGLSFEVLSTPSETYDAVTVWIPERKSAFVGDLYYKAFPNLYTLRGTKPRWALDYVRSLNKVLDLRPEYLIPSHGQPIVGWSAINATLSQYRDAILYVHDAVVLGMNQGKSIDNLVNEIRLPEDLKVPEIYGQLDWSIRGIYLGYAGWFDGNPTSMLGVNASESYHELVKLSGGVQVVAERAQKLFSDGADRQALSLADIILTIDSDNLAALEIRRKVFSNYLQETSNFNAQGWLKHGIRESQ